MCAIAMALLLALLVPVGLAAQDKTAQPDQPKHHRYRLTDTGTLGGPTSSLGFEGERDINSQGTVVSLADTPLPDPYAPNCFLDCFLAHSVEWRDGVLTDFGALPPINNSGPAWISDTGLVSGISEDGVIDPLTGFPELRAVFWNDGNLTDLGTLGGNESIGGAVNNHGQVAGCANNATPDSFGLGCLGFAADPQEGRAFLWQNGVMQDLGTLGGPDSSAGLVNESGEVAGWALLDSTPNPTTGIPTQHPFLWDHGVMKDLGTIGGTAVFEVNSLNNRGQVAGGMNVAGDQSYHPFLWDGQSLKDLGTLGGTFGNAFWLNEGGAVTGWANLPGDLTNHAFLWKHGAMTDLGVLAGDQCSVAFVVNSKEQVVGDSADCTGANQHAFLWEKGSMADLNNLVPSGTGVQLTIALGLNERGAIAAQGVLPNGEVHAFLLTPCGDGDDNCGGTVTGAPAAIPANAAFNGHGMLDRFRTRRFLALARTLAQPDQRTSRNRRVRARNGKLTTDQDDSQTRSEGT
jgi:probable HAF family extracellular repeat protein